MAFTNEDVPEPGWADDIPVGKASTISLDDARQLLAQEQLMRLQECQTALMEPQSQINQTLKDHNCTRLIEGQLPSGAWVPVSDLGFIDVRIRIVDR